VVRISEGNVKSLKVIKGFMEDEDGVVFMVQIRGEANFYFPLLASFMTCFE
jgi:hypothetical protein